MTVKFWRETCFASNLLQKRSLDACVTVSIRDQARYACVFCLWVPFRIETHKYARYLHPGKNGQTNVPQFAAKNAFFWSFSSNFECFHSMGVTEHTMVDLKLAAELIFDI